MTRLRFWYSIDMDCNSKFERFMQKKFPDNYAACKEFIRHKTFHVHP